jgi:hypothetical protein
MTGCSAAAGVRAAGTVPGLRVGGCCRQRVLACATGARVRLGVCVAEWRGQHRRQGSGPQVLLLHARFRVGCRGLACLAAVVGCGVKRGLL